MKSIQSGRRFNLGNHQTIHNKRNKKQELGTIISPYRRYIYNAYVTPLAKMSYWYLQYILIEKSLFIYHLQ